MIRFSEPLRFTSRRPADYEAILKIADSLEPKLRKAFLEAVAKIQGSVNITALIRDLERRAVEQALGSISLKAFEVTFKDVAQEIIKTAITKAGNAAALVMPPSFNLRFDITNPRVFDWIQKQTGRLIIGVTDETRAAVRQLIERGFREGRTVQQMSRDIKGLVGLTHQQATAVGNFEKARIAAGLKGERLEKSIERYRQKMLRLRATNIARTETMLASNRGQQLLWEQGLETGLIRREKWEQKWVITPDDRLCPLCQEMTGKRAPMNGAFEGGSPGPPLHPSCRCTIVLVETKARAVA